MEFLRQKRQVALFYLFILAFVLLIYHFWTIQVRDHASYSWLAAEQGCYSVALEDVPRGRILDRNLIPLTDGTREKKVIVFPMLIDNKTAVACTLAGILKVEPAQVESYFKRGACALPFNLGDEECREIELIQSKGVLALPVSTRYGGRPLASQVLGHLGKITSPSEYKTLTEGGAKPYRYNDLVGKAGLEAIYEQDLKGLYPKSAVRVFHDAAGKLTGGGPVIEENLNDKGRRDLVLCIDSRIQQIVEDIMDRMVIKGAVVVMEAGSGDILAMAGRPAYQPAHMEEYLKMGGQDRFSDHCTALYQPGSVFKVVVAAAALEEGLVTPGTMFTCTGEKESLIHCWYRPGHGSLTFAEAFAQSCNPVFARLALELGPAKLIGYARRLGMENQSITGYPVQFDSRQNLELIGAPYNLVNSSVGQGPVLATPVQVAEMINTIVSGGFYHTPRLVKELRTEGGDITRLFEPSPGQQSLSQKTVQDLQKLMEMVTERGVGREAYVPEQGSAGKTGTAQLSGEDGGVNAWFAGYAPLANPRYVVAVLVEGGVSGGESAAPVFKEIIEKILSN